MLRHGSWNPGSVEELKIGRHTVRLKRSLGEGGFAFIHLVEVRTGTIDLVLTYLCAGNNNNNNNNTNNSSSSNKMFRLAWCFSVCCIIAWGFFVPVLGVHKLLLQAVELSATDSRISKIEYIAACI